MDDRSLLLSIADLVGRETTLDDCAILPYGEVEFLVATTDMLHETTDFPEGMTEWQCGWMAAAVTLSDIASMAATPRFLLIAAGLDRWQRLRPIMQGAKDCCDRYGVQIVGGDIDYHAELTLVTTGLGTVDQSRLVRRRGSRIGDLICITGTPGRAQAALEGFRQFEKALFEPEPLVREGEILGGAGVTSMMDVSDGLALSLYDLMEANSCGYRIDSSLLPLPTGIPEDTARKMALYGGGDYELLFTCPQEKMPIPGVQYTIIGSVIPDRDVRIDGRVLEKRGYQHKWSEVP